MITVELLGRFIARAEGQARTEGERYVKDDRVRNFVGSGESVLTVVKGQSDDFHVVLWVDGDELAHRCSCPSWRDPCKHQIAAALTLEAWLVRRADGSTKREQGKSVSGKQTGTDGKRAIEEPEDPAAARNRALGERLAAARREELTVSLETAPEIDVSSASGFAYTVHVRGGIDGPHACDCPDFEANRLHTCKHVERVRAHLREYGKELSDDFREAADRPRVYLHFGEVVEPRLFGRPEGEAATVIDAFDADGLPLQPLATDDRDLLDRLRGFGDWVDPRDLAWLTRRIDRRPELPSGELRELIPDLRLEPYDYQWEGARFLATSGRALLADEMGLGKTIQAIVAAVALRSAKRPARRVVIVCPASLRAAWKDEIARWVGEEAVLLEGRGDDRTATIKSRPRWLITHYEQVWRDYESHVSDPPDLLIVDEAQRAKGLMTRTARVLKAIDARYVFALTGTPLANRLEEAYAIAQLIDQRLLPPLWQLERDHFVREVGSRRVVLYRNLDVMRSRLAPAFLRRRKEDVALELPPRLRSLVMVDLHPDVRARYDDLMGQVAAIARKSSRRPGELERMQRLLVLARRACDGPHMLGQTIVDHKVPKLLELEEALRDLCLGEGRKAVVFSEWTDMTFRIESLCGRLGLPVFHLYGGVPVAKRGQLVRSFTETDGAAVFVSTDAGGLGLNLQAADVVINLDLPWNPARLEQRIARVHRIGSETPVQIVLIVTRESVESRILGLHEAKQKVLDSIWADDGDDVIIAPGGGEAFREVTEELLGRSTGSDGRVDVAEPSHTGTVADAGSDTKGLVESIAVLGPSLTEHQRKALAAELRALADSLAPDDKDS